jgi:starch-binding outer membrane protein, SusD/RagB family
MKRTISLVILILGILMFNRCKKFVELPPPDNLIVTEDVFSSDAKAASAMIAIYGNMINLPQSFSNFLSTTCGGLSSDELKKFQPSTSEVELSENQLTASNGFARIIWSTAYKNIYYANSILEGLKNSNQISIIAKNQLRGEALFVRSFCYFYLVNFYGDVPLITTTSYAENATKPRAPVSEIYSYMISDLEESKILLSAVYQGGERVRPNKWAATALLSRVYLYRQNWEKAESNANEVINCGLYSPLQPLQAVFLKNSSESIFQLMQKSGPVPECRQLRPGSNGRPLFYFTDELKNAFEAGDLRKTRWVDSVTYLGVKYHFPGKYKNTTNTITEYYMVLRAAEQYLIRAEARVKQHNPVGALADLNIIRARAGLSLLSGLTEEAVENAIEKEWRIEFFSEWGQRWINVKRNGDANLIFGALKPGWQSTDVLYPIPHEDILANPNLQQNPGY